MEKIKNPTTRIGKDGKRKVLFATNLEEELYYRLYSIADREKSTMTSLLNRILNTYIICYERINENTENIITKSIIKNKGEKNG